MQDGAILRQRAKVQLVKDDTLVPFLPARVAIVEVTLADGTTLTERVDAVRGTVRNPMTKREIVDKARDLIVPILGAQKCDRLIDVVYSLERVPAIGDLRSLLQNS
jgi:2-methylcitrate dehydratase PrpD